MLFREGEKPEGFCVFQTDSVGAYKIPPDGREQISRIIDGRRLRTCV